MKRKNKNISLNFPNGTRVQTRDEFLSNDNFSKQNHPNIYDLYRKTYIIDSNSDDELVLVKETTHGGKTKKDIDVRYIYIYDNENKPIKIDGRRFVIKCNKYSKPNIDKYKKKIFTGTKRARNNRRLVHLKVKKRK